MDHIWFPSEFLYCLKHAASEEYSSLSVILEEFPIFIAVHALAVEVVLVVDEIHLHSCSRNGSYLDYKWPVYVIDDDVHTRKSYDLMQLVLPFVNASIARHEGSYLLLPFLNALWKVSSNVRDVRFREIWKYL